MLGFKHPGIHGLAVHNGPKLVAFALGQWRQFVAGDVQVALLRIPVKHHRRRHARLQRHQVHHLVFGVAHHRSREHDTAETVLQGLFFLSQTELAGIGLGQQCFGLLQPVVQEYICQGTDNQQNAGGNAPMQKPVGGIRGDARRGLLRKNGYWFFSVGWFVFAFRYRNKRLRLARYVWLRFFSGFSAFVRLPQGGHYPVFQRGGRCPGKFLGIRFQCCPHGGDFVLDGRVLRR